MTEWKFKICCCLLIKRSLKNELRERQLQETLHATKSRRLALVNLLSYVG
jgi:hypothetical protein